MVDIEIDEHLPEKKVFEDDYNANCSDEDSVEKMKCIECDVSFTSKFYFHNHLLLHIKQPIIHLERVKLAVAPIKLTLISKSNNSFEIVHSPKESSDIDDNNDQMYDAAAEVAETANENCNGNAVSNIDHENQSDECADDEQTAADSEENHDGAMMEEVEEIVNQIAACEGADEEQEQEQQEENLPEENHVAPSTDEITSNELTELLQEIEAIPGGEPTPPPEAELPKIRIKTSGLLKERSRNWEIYASNQKGQPKSATLSDLFTNNDRAKDLGFTTSDPDFGTNQELQLYNPTNSTNPLETLNNLPMQQLAQQVSRLQPNRNGLHQQNVLINIQQFPQAPPHPQPHVYAPPPFPHQRPQMYAYQYQPPPPPMYYNAPTRYHPTHMPPSGHPPQMPPQPPHMPQQGMHMQSQTQHMQPPNQQHMQTQNQHMQPQMQHMQPPNQQHMQPPNQHMQQAQNQHNMQNQNQHMQQAQNQHMPNQNQHMQPQNQHIQSQHMQSQGQHIQSAVPHSSPSQGPAHMRPPTSTMPPPSQNQQQNHNMQQPRNPRPIPNLRTWNGGQRLQHPQPAQQQNMVRSNIRVNAPRILHCINGFRGRMPNPNQIRPPSSVTQQPDNGGQKMPMKRKIPQPSAAAAATQNKQKKMDALILNTNNDDPDCQVISVQPTTKGMPQIQSIQGNVSEPAAAGFNLPQSITLSLKTPLIKPTPAVVTNKTEASDVANILATRGITVISSAKNKPPAPKLNQPEQASVAINLNNAVSIIPTKANNGTNHSANPQNETNRLTTVDLTEEQQEAQTHVKATQSSRVSKVLPFQCDLCPAKYPSSESLSKHRISFHKTKQSEEYAIPLINIRQPGVLNKLSNIGITNYIPYYIGNNDDGFAIPIINVQNKDKYFNALGAQKVIQLGPMHSLQNVNKS